MNKIYISLPILLSMLLFGCGQKAVNTVVKQSASPTVQVSASPTSTKSAQPVDNSYTLAEVAKHNNASDCWTVIDKDVLNVTPFVNDHPGGREILRACGRDGTNLFMSVDDHGTQAMDMVQALKIGVLK